MDKYVYALIIYALTYIYRYISLYTHTYLVSYIYI